MCLNPISIKTVDAFGIDVNQSVPCGKCIECLKDAQNSWKIRLTEEARDHLYVYFFTLTYNDDSVPFTILDDGTRVNHVSKIDIQLWIKRNRIKYERMFNRDIDFKYFVTSEYGPNTGRPHYHGILYTDISPTFIALMFNDWKDNFGFVNFSDVRHSKKKSFRRCISSVGNYVAKYCLKPHQLRTEAEFRINGYIEQVLIPPPFRLMSHGIGASYVKRMRRYHTPYIRDPRTRITVVCDRSFYHDGAFKYKLPRYFRDRLYRMKFPCDAKVWNKKLKIYENKTVYRYKSKNPLALAMQVEVRNRVLAEFNEKFSRAKAMYPSKSDTEILIELERASVTARNTRRQDIFSKMSRFYNYNKHKVKSF